jgi:hypothetical protein
VPQVSSLSIAVQGIADFLDGHFGEDVLITVDTPHRAHERSRNADTHCLNLFVYRIAPSGFHPELSSEETQFLRINTLLTPFPGNQEGVDDADLRILGHAIRILQSEPVIPVAALPGAPDADPLDFRHQPHLDFRLQAILQTPSMEELNHIWTTQGGELAYRLSAAYEFALIPIEPLVLATPPVPATTAIFDVDASVERATAAGLLDLTEATTAVPIGGRGPDNPSSPVDWLPVLLLVGAGRLTNHREIPPGTAQVPVALAGPPGERVALEVAWVRQDSSEDAQSAQVFQIQTPRIDDPQALIDLTLDNAADGDAATILTRPVDDADVAPPTSPLANTLTLEVVAP